MSVRRVCHPSCYVTLLALFCLLPRVARARVEGQVLTGVGVLDADAAAWGSGDVGAKINAAFRSCMGASCVVTLPPGKSYAFATKILVPAIAYAVLDCNGSTLTWAGAGDAVLVASMNGEDPSGGVNHCKIVNAKGNAAAVDAIHQLSRVSFSYDGDSVYGFTGARSAAIELENTKTSWGGYNERTYFHRLSLSNNTKGIRFVGNHGGTNSFGYSMGVALEFSVAGGQTAVSIEGSGPLQSADVYGGLWDMKMNATCHTACRFVSVTNGGSLRSALVNLTAESQGSAQAYALYVDGGDSGINVFGQALFAAMRNYNGGTSSQLQLQTVAQGDLALQAPSWAHGVMQARNSKLHYDGANLMLGIPVSAGVEQNGYFQVFGRVTANPADPEVDVPAKGSAQQPFNVMYVDALSRGTGLGAGFGTGAPPRHTLDVHGEMTVSNPGLGIDGTAWTRSLDAEGNGIDFFAGAKAKGQASYRVTEVMRDYTTGATVQGASRMAYGGRVHTAAPLHTPTGSSEACTAGETTDDVNFHYVCVGANRWKRVALSAF